MKKNSFIKELTLEECKNTVGGSFAWDAGWLLGNTIAGNFLSQGGIADALADYVIHYYVEDE